MKHLDLNAFMQDVHQNAVAHGWHDKERSDGTMRSLFHCELSEAVESYRKGEPDWWHRCPYAPGACETQEVHENESLHCEACSDSARKPEGAAVEFADFVIRVFDYLGSICFVLPQALDTAEKLAAWAVDDYQDDEITDATSLDAADLADVLHTHIALSKVMHNVTYLTCAVGLVLAWIKKRGMDPVKILLEKHEYNKSRSYRHGGKVC